MSPLISKFPPRMTAIVIGAFGGVGAALTGLLAADPAIATLVTTARTARAILSTPTGDDRDVDDQNKDNDAKRLHYPLDVTDEDSIEMMANDLRAREIFASLIINCTGSLHDLPKYGPERQLADISPERMLQSYAVNAVGPALIAKHLAGRIVRRQHAVFATLSARVGSIGDNRLGGWYAYRASKAAQNMITRNLSIELKRQHPKLVCVALHPGTVDTALSEPFLANVKPQQLFTPTTAAQHLLQVVGNLTTKDNGGFFAWDGKPIPW
jgi:NAD(P)-dependent dehydrogenase (short-subunit alcohol dehydrogenase family)